MWTEFRQRKVFWSVVILLPLVSILAAVWTLTWPTRQLSNPVSLSITPTVSHELLDATAPNFELASLDFDTRIRLSSLRGQLVFINFWATWCEPCRREFPAFQHYATQPDSPGIILAVNVGDDADQIAAFLDEVGVPNVMVLLDTDFRVSDAYAADFFPSTFIVDPAGVVRAVHIGEITAADLQDYAAAYAS